MKKIYKHESIGNSFFMEMCEIENEDKFNYERGLFRIIWCDRGKGVIVKENYKDQFESKQLLFCNPYNSKVIFTEKGNKVYVCSFSYELFARLIANNKSLEFFSFFFSRNFSGSVSLNEHQDSNIRYLTKEIIYELKNSLLEKEDMLMLILGKIVLLYKRASSITTPTHGVAIDIKGRNLIKDFYLLIEKEYKSIHKVSEYAKLLNVSTVTLSNSFRSQPSSPLQLIHKRLLIEAKRLLEYSDLSIKEITYSLGFQESAHFHKFFKRLTSNSPTEFRKKIKDIDIGN